MEAHCRSAFNAIARDRARRSTDRTDKGVLGSLCRGRSSAASTSSRGKADVLQLAVAQGCELAHATAVGSGFQKGEKASNETRGDPDGRGPKKGKRVWASPGHGAL